MLFQFHNLLRVAGLVARELLLPEPDVGLGHGRPLAAFMLVPEAAVNEDHGLPAGKHDVRGAGKVATVEPEAVAQSMEQPADTKLGLGVFLLNQPHDSTSFFR